MLSVTSRIKTIAQPKGGYVPCSIFNIHTYEDYYEILETRSDLLSIQGLAVDYLTRYMLTNDKMSAFDISIKGAKKIDEAYENDAEIKKINILLNEVNGLDKRSVIAACKRVCYDSALRRGIFAYRNYEDIEFTDELFRNIPILVNRCISFFDSIGEMKATKMTFEGGYTDIVSSGDGDYLCADMLIDLKVSKNKLSTYWTLQLLMYYLMGFHSIYEEYKQLKRICIYNPLKNQSYICNIKDISDESKYKVSHEVIGYKMINNCFCFDKNENIIYDYSKWKEIDGSDKHILKAFLDTYCKTDFQISKYEDGIFDITIDDYWTYLQTFDEFRNRLKPSFRYTKYIKLIKHSGYFMFVSVSNKGKYSLLHGAGVHSLKYSLEYYYDFLEQYATIVISNFSKYWDALRSVSEQIKSLEPTEDFLRQRYSQYLEFSVSKTERLSFDEWYKEQGSDFQLSGKIHGCIVDIDYSNHLYINPMDGSITPYYAQSIYDKDIYTNIRSLLAAQRAEMLPAFDKMIESQKDNISLITQDRKTTNISIISQNNEISAEFVKVYAQDMYEMSNKLKPLQKVYDYKLVQVWYDDILGNNSQLEDKHFIKKNRV